MKLLPPSPVTLTPVIDIGREMYVCRHGLGGVCVSVCAYVHEWLRLIEVVRVKMIPSGGT